MNTKEKNRPDLINLILMYVVSSLFQNAVKSALRREVLEPKAVDIYCVFALGKYSVANITNTARNHFQKTKRVRKYIS